VIEDAVVRSVESSKARDDDRGAAVIPDYPDTHLRACDDPVVRLAHTRLEALRAQVEGLMGSPSLAEVLDMDLGAALAGPLKPAREPH
jgi:hypothetical protein